MEAEIYLNEVNYLTLLWNILQIHTTALSLISEDFGLYGPANEQNLDDKVYGVLLYIAPEVLNGEPYKLSAVAELSSGKSPLSLALAICNGIKPEFG
ncbi:uncharacterized protein OCT59_027461 [Rhizophagus irregularis]|uniref:uncharacterized protein n=1 Tax=Rhizophagus irregularis TaxID=588596 RepID=UPI001A053097|nr:hypothetical protein OCT59_027461 [Rhizophagus irregularis]GET65589.1 kinase-like domain-containing protein [Rhizophagus irregularis DAOM 181602=DAOM 197198]